MKRFEVGMLVKALGLYGIVTATIIEKNAKNENHSLACVRWFGAADHDTGYYTDYQLEIVADPYEMYRIENSKATCLITFPDFTTKTCEINEDKINEEIKKWCQANDFQPDGLFSLDYFMLDSEEGYGVEVSKGDIYDWIDIEMSE